MLPRHALWIVPALVFGSTADAYAFGGVFTADDGTNAPIPADLRMARVVFEVDTGMITAHVQLTFDGAPNEIAWVLPVRDVPQVSEGALEFMNALEEATQLGVRMPASEPCLAPEMAASDSAGGCNCSDPLPIPQRPGPLGGAMSDHPPVIVHSTQFTDSYTVTTVGASTSDVLLAWLEREGFVASANMAPAMDAYNQVGMKFVVIRIRNDGGASETPPLTLRYPGDQPIVPLELTAVAARPHFGLQVMILANDTYTPENYVVVPPTPSEILFDDDHHISYFDWTARTAANSNGHLFVTEFIGPSPIAMGEMLGGIEVRHPFLSRFYTRVSPAHMDDDPRFFIHPDATFRVMPEIDLITEPSLYTCNELVEARLPSACAFNYCGAQGSCAVIDDRAGCICAAGDVAERIVGPDGTARVVCGPRVNTFGVDPETTTLADPCSDIVCGQGACVNKNGVATCDCLPGMVATLALDAVICLEPPPGFETFGPGGGVESRPVVMAAAPLDRATVYAGAVWALVIVALGFGRRLRSRLG